ncbi:MAG: RidA family protein [Bacteroidota bacterium]
MNRTNIASVSDFEKFIGFSRAVRVGDYIHISGTAPIGDDGKTAFTDDLYRQTLRCIEIMQKAIEDAGGSLGDVVRTRVFLTDVSRWKEAAKAHGEVFQEIRPACTFLEVSGFIDPDWLVEMEADCIINLD